MLVVYKWRVDVQGWYTNTATYWQVLVLVVLTTRCIEIHRHRRALLLSLLWTTCNLAQSEACSNLMMNSLKSLVAVFFNAQIPPTNSRLETVCTVFLYSFLFAQKGITTPSDRPDIRTSSKGRASRA